MITLKRIKELMVLKGGRPEGILNEHPRLMHIGF